MDKNNQNAKKLSGFYIAVCCCVIAIGITGMIVNNTSENDELEAPVAAEKTDEPYYAFDAASTATPIEPEAEPTIPAPVTSIDTAAVMDENYAYDNPDVVSASVTVNAEESCDFIDPLAEMSVSYGFSGDTLMYNEVYGDWRTHNGIDIEAPIGCSVNCTAKGSVTDIKEGIFGKTVTIEHDNGFKSIYAQLGEVSVSVGDTVEQGAVIGTVGESIGENDKKPHLHYELHKDNKPQNPEEY
ncbi:MAG: M23 family metallopeptidase [Clostridia bacterium]|nr:M23 family metallopeptidase [Clostridia bacterium]